VNINYCLHIHVWCAIVLGPVLELQTGLVLVLDHEGLIRGLGLEWLVLVLGLECMVLVNITVVSKRHQTVTTHGGLVRSAVSGGEFDWGGTSVL